MNEDEYEGILKKPLPEPAFVMYDEDEHSQEISKRINALFKHYNIPPSSPGSWQALALALARQHVPAFRPPPRKQGRPREHLDEDVSLYMLVELGRRRDGLSISAACRQLATQKLVNGKANTLRARYNRRRSELAPFKSFLDTLEHDYGKEYLVDKLEYALEPLIRKKDPGT